MRRALVLFTALVGCAAHANPPPPLSVAVALPSLATQSVEHGPAPVADEPQTPEGGDYSSAWGMVHLTVEPDGSLGGSYPRGVLTCPRPVAEALECRWYEASAEGRARFTRKPDGALEGTWGSGESADDGGAWLLVPLQAGGGGGLDGAWDTNWGIARVKETGHGAHIDYPNGTMDCELHEARRLTCAWVQGSMAGHAELTVESGILRGRWGNGASATDGGAWVFVRR